MGGIVLAAIDIHKAVFQAAVLEPANGEITEERFTASREALVGWIEKWGGRLDVVALEATTGWRWGPILACTILAEIGDAKRFRRARQVIRAAGLDPVVKDSADKQRRGQLAKQGPPCLRWALVEAAQHACRKNSPDHQLYLRQRGHAGANPATLTIARKIGKGAFHVLRELEAQAA
jgi:hypothetical protein